MLHVRWERHITERITINYLDDIEKVIELVTTSTIYLSKNMTGELLLVDATVGFDYVESSGKSRVV